MKNLVQIIDGKAVTTSRKVAEVFEKQHKNVLQSIRELEIPESYRELNFQPSVYEQPNPSGGKPIEHPEYLITRDGFTILAMGFTGKKAMEFKLAYIEAFNEMEKALTGIGCTTAIPCPAESSSNNLLESTKELLLAINARLRKGEDIEAHILKYCWNMATMVKQPVVTRAISCDDYINRFVGTIPRGEQLNRSDVYSSYCDFCRAESCTPKSPRSFLPQAAKCAQMRNIRTSNARYIIIEL